MASKQTELEKKAIEKRESLELKNTYSSEDGFQYKEGSKDMLSDGDVKGKGTGVSSPGYVKGSHFDTTKGGGLYDIKGRGENSGREFLTTINTYGPNNEYGVDMIDTSGNKVKGQYFVK